MKIMRKILPVLSLFSALLLGISAMPPAMANAPCGSYSPGAILNQQVRNMQLLQREPWLNRPVKASDYTAPPSDDLIDASALAFDINIPDVNVPAINVPAVQPGASPIGPVNIQAVQPQCQNVQGVTIEKVQPENTQFEQINVDAQTFH